MMFDVVNLYGRRADNRWERMCVGDMLERMTWSDPDKLVFLAASDAVVDPEYATVTYRQANQLANRIANALLALELPRASRVVLLCDNSVEAYITKLAIAKTGLVVVPINPMLASDIVEYILGYVEPSAVIVDAELWQRHEESFLRAGIHPTATICAGGGPVDGSPSLAEFIASASDAEPDVRIHGDDIWEILLTSGTTARPKAVMLSHTYAYMVGYSYALTYSRGLTVECDVRTGTFLPMIYHVADHGCVLPALLSGGSVVIGRRLGADAVASAVTRFGITGLWGGSPQFLSDLVAAVDAASSHYDLQSLTAVVFGWSAVSPSLSAALRRLAGGQVALIEVFGQTEANAGHRFWIDRWPDKHVNTAPEANYIGIPAPILAADIVDSEGRSLVNSPGVAGETVYRSPAMTAGYYKDEPATATAFQNGWFHSGDSCVYDGEGLRIMVDRYKDVVKSGGENVSSLRVEAVIAQHPEVQRVAVVGIPHPKWGEAVTAVIVPKPDATVTEEDIITFSRARLAGYETPKGIVFVDELPETVGGKVLKYRLRENLSGGEIFAPKTP